MVMLCLIVVGMVLETLGIGLVVPAVAFMTQADFVERYPAIAPVLEKIGSPSQSKIVVLGMLALVGFYAVKTAFLTFLAWWRSRFVFRIQAEVSFRLYQLYLGQPYIFHLGRNSAQLIRNCIGQVADFAHVILQSLYVITEAFVLTGIFCLFLAMEPGGAFAATIVIGLASWGLYFLTRQHMLRWGVARQFHEGLRIQHLQQGLGGAKEVKLFGRELEFLKQYDLHNLGTAKVTERWATLQQIPRLWLELFGVTGLVAVVLVMMARGEPSVALLPVLGLFAAAAFRIIPSINRILIAIQSMRYNFPAVNNIYSELSVLNMQHRPGNGKPLRFSDSLRLEEIVFRYPSGESDVLCSVSLSISRGESVGFIGPSGAGKSTLVDILLGLITPCSGRVLVDRIDIQTNIRGWQDKIGYVPQAIYLTDDTLRRNVAFGIPNEQIDESAVWIALRAAQLEQFLNDLPQGLDTIMGERGIRLSGGQRQRIGIARALYHDPPVLVLDEATSSLDSVTERGFMAAVHELQGVKTIIIVSHRMSTVEHCDSLHRFECGRVIRVSETVS